MATDDRLAAVRRQIGFVERFVVFTQTCLQGSRGSGAGVADGGRRHGSCIGGGPRVAVAVGIAAFFAEHGGAEHLVVGTEHATVVGVARKGQRARQAAEIGATGVQVVQPFFAAFLLWLLLVVGLVSLLMVRVGAWSGRWLLLQMVQRVLMMVLGHGVEIRKEAEMVTAISRRRRGGRGGRRWRSTH